MSYILDALRKADRDRHVPRVPTLDTAHGGADLVRRAQWAWAAAAGALVLSAIVISSLLWAPTRPDPVREAALAVAAGPAAAPASADPGKPAPPLERAAERTETVPVLAPGPAVERRPGGRPPTQPRVAPVAPPSTPQVTHPADDLRRAPERTGTPAAPATRQAAAAEARPTVPAVVGDRPSVEPRPAGDPVAQPAAALAPLPDAGAGRAAQPAPAQTLARLTLDVLVYSDVLAERLVFINGRKYVEGQTLDGETVVEQITPDGAVLRHQGKQVVLRPKLNPYARPGSP